MPGPEHAPELPPWLAEPWARLRAAHGAGRTPTGLLLSGSGDVGQRWLALAFARHVLDLPPAGPDLEEALAIPAHPDFRDVGPEDRQQIPVDAIRGISAFAQQTARGHAKVVLVDPADRMNRSAANALLKTLEEPAPGTLLLLTGYGAPLLPTIVSRCQRVALHVPAEAARTWLGAQGLAPDDVAAAMLLHGAAPLECIAGAPGERAADGAGVRVDGWLRALDRMLAAELDGTGVGRLAGELADGERARELVGLLWRVIHLALAVRLGAPAPVPSSPPALEPVLRRLAQRGETTLVQDAALAQGALARLEGPTNPNPRLLVHALLVSLRDRPEPSGWPERDLGFTIV